MKKTYLIISALLALSLSSCSGLLETTESFFTTSWGTGAKRDLSETFSKQSTEELATSISDPEVISDKEASNAILVALGNKDQSEINALSVELKNDVLDLTLNTTISIDSLLSVVDELSTSTEESSAQDVISTILEQFADTDMTAAQTILNNVDEIENLNSSTACLATVCLAAQVMKDIDFKDTENLTTEIETIMNKMDNDGKTAVEAIKEADFGLSEEKQETLAVALNAMQKLTDIDAEIIAGITIGDLLGTSDSSQDNSQA